MLTEDREKIRIHSAMERDRDAIMHLIHFGERVHQHLDWMRAVDWLDQMPFYLAEVDGNIRAALACPPDPERVAWIRVFAAVSATGIYDLWDALWERAHQDYLLSREVDWVVAILIQSWMKKLLVGKGFVERQRVVLLEWLPQDLPAGSELPLEIREMRREDLPIVEKIDAAAFHPIWRNSLRALENAFIQAEIATIAFMGQKAVAYQISTATNEGGHLARLAVLPDFHSQGIGFAMVRDVLEKFLRRGARKVTVNTQSDNLASLGLYAKLGFQRTGDEFPVYQYQF